MKIISNPKGSFVLELKPNKSCPLGLEADELRVKVKYYKTRLEARQLYSVKKYIFSILELNVYLP